MELLKFIAALVNKHGTKILGYLATTCAFIAIADKKLVADTLGANATTWALLITGILGAARGHQATAKEKREAELDRMIARTPQVQTTGDPQ